MYSYKSCMHLDDGPGCLASAGMPGVPLCCVATLLGAAGLTDLPASPFEDLFRACTRKAHKAAHKLRLSHRLNPHTSSTKFAGARKTLSQTCRAFSCGVSAFAGATSSDFDAGAWTAFCRPGSPADNFVCWSSFWLLACCLAFSSCKATTSWF